jgi:hypothetical protein
LEIIVRTMITVLAATIMMGALSASADRYTVNLGDAEIITVQDATPGLGDYFVLQLQPPEGISAQALRHAVLEVYVDASARVIEGYEEETPMFEIHALDGPMTAGLNPALFRAQSTPSVRNVVVGSARRVVIDITEIVRDHLIAPGSNYGIVMGSLTGARAGLFTLRDDRLGDAAKVRVSFFD